MEAPATQSDSIGRNGRGWFSREEAAGYDRNVIDRANVILVGCGALGQFLALALALIGYPHVLFIDMDRFEESNISRSPFYRRGCNKAEAAALAAQRLCTATGPIRYRYANCMVQWLGDAVFRPGERTIVLLAVDGLPARWWVAERCRAMGVPLVEGGFHADRWNLSIFPNNAGDPCWACSQGEIETGRVFSCDTYARQAIEAGFIPATAPGAMSLAAWQLAAATALAHGDSTLANTTVFGDLRTGRTQLMRSVANPDCSLGHAIACQDALQLDCRPEDSVGTLLAEAETLMPEPVVQLPASFIRTAPCGRCRRPVLVERPEWAVEGVPICASCGGSFIPGEGLLLEQHGSLSSQTCETILETPLRTLNSVG